MALSLGDASRVRDTRAPGGPLGVPPLFYVARSRIANDGVAAARDLLSRGADPNGQAGEQWTNLSIACARGDAALVRLLLAAGAEPNDDDSLYHSVEPPDDGCLRLLLEHGATVPGTSALWHALDYERTAHVRLLLDGGGDPNEGNGSWPALHHAVVRGRSPAIVGLLLERGADPAARDASNRTAYQHAVRRARRALADLLASRGAPVDLNPDDLALAAIADGKAPRAIDLDDDGREAIVDLAMRNADALARVVDAVGLRFSARLGGGPCGTLLHQAAWLGRPDLVALLLRRGADPNEQVETTYSTPLGWAAVGSRYAPSHPDASFASPDADHVAVVERLVDAGADVADRDAEMAAPPLRAWLDAHRGR